MNGTKKTAKTCMGGHVGGVLCGMIINKMNVKLKFVVKGKNKSIDLERSNFKNMRIGVDEMHKLWKRHTKL
jgi:hypothetical protein